MCSLEQFKIDLKALTEDVTPWDCQLTDQFFAALDEAEIGRYRHTNEQEQQAHHEPEEPERGWSYDK